MVGGILIFVFSGQIKEKIIKVIYEEGIVRYRDDPDLQSIFDWVQETVSPLVAVSKTRLFFHVQYNIFIFKSINYSSTLDCSSRPNI